MMTKQEQQNAYSDQSNQKSSGLRDDDNQMGRASSNETPSCGFDSGMDVILTRPSDRSDR